MISQLLSSKANLFLLTLLLIIVIQSLIKQQMDFVKEIEAIEAEIENKS